LRALILLLSTDVKKFFRTIKEVSCTPGKKLPGKKAEWAPQVNTGTGWQTAVPLANGISTESHQNTAIYQPGTTNPGESSKDDKPTPTNQQSSGRSVLAIINEAVPNLGGLASVPSRRCVIILAVGSLTMNAHMYSGTENSLKKAASLNQDSVWAAAPRTWEA
jgi:hypothetical protein